MINEADRVKRRKLLRDFIALPAQDSSWRFRTPIDIDPKHGPDDLAPFVALSDVSAEIADAHPDLYGQTRHALYQKWHAWNPDAFQVLEKRNEKGEWVPAAVSIILPLTSEAYKGIQGGTKAVLNLEANDVVPAGMHADHLLIDTWIVDPQLRHAHGRQGNALILKHLGQFWDPSKKEDMHIMVEPDNESITHIAQACKFDGPVTTPDGGHIYTLNASEKQRAADPILAQLANNVSSYRTMDNGINR